MTVNDDKKGRAAPPPVQVIRRPTGPGPQAPTPGSGPAPTSVAPRPTPAGAPVRPTGPRPGGRPGGPPRPGFGRPRAPRPPPTQEQIEALARREHVPTRIAKGELDGKMKARIWRKLHAEEAKRFDQAYAILDKTPGIELADAFALLQSGMTLEEYQARRARTQKRAAVKEARSAVAGEGVDTLLQRYLEEGTELAFVLGGRTVFDSLKGIRRVAFDLTRSGRLEKLQLVLLAPRATWEPRSPQVPREPKLAQKPETVAREPDRRPFSDPRPFEPAVGQTVKVTLRNGIQLVEPLRALGPFDLVLGADGQELIVPIHALLSWEAAGG